ncbi:MAG: SGNH/GDSL hydrolase family protein [Oscillospiraceae bacterium]|nr:SGNH/GDSL hydrolase family protein [Oscillospiraceae bacterium]
MKILFQGDSITDCGRDRSDYHNLGEGYPLFASEFIKQENPGIKFEFINLGISGNQTADLVDRLQSDFIDIKPDLVSIMIGINDTWHRAENRKWLGNDVFEANYRKVISEIREKTSAKILMLEAFLLPVPDKEYFRVDLDPKIQIERKLAREFADYFIPVDGLLAQACIGKPSSHWSDDGVHPNRNGAEFIGRLYADAFNQMVELGILKK